MNNILAASTSFSPNLIRDLKEMWQYPFMQHAFQAGTLVAIVAGVVGYFVVLRRLSFAAHALSHIGFSGAAGAVLIGLNPLAGLLAFTIGGGTTIALLGKRAINQDVQIGTVLAFILGLGVLFISLYKGYATEAYSLLFGEILGISARSVAITAIAVLFTLAAVTVLFRKLVFTSIDEDVAEAKGISLPGMNVAFMVLVALAVSVSVQVVGVLLIFALMVTPAAIADRIAKRPVQGVAISVGVSVLATWVSLFVSYYLPYPVSFFITSLTFGGYLVVHVWQWRSKTSS
jgi:zinc/manganese transport system permease protein